MNLIEQLLFFFPKGFVVVVCDVDTFLESLIVSAKTNQLFPFVFERDTHFLLNNVLNTIDIILSVVKSVFVLIPCLNKIKFK